MLARLRQPALALFAAAFFVSNWDLLLIRKTGGFTLKAYQPLFLLCAAFTAWPWLRSGRWAEYVAPLRRPFIVAMLGLAFFYLGLAPWSAFPLKSFLYSCWLLFDIGVVWLTVQHLFDEAPPEFFARVAFAPVLFSAVVILIDYAAYPFGYRGGLIGYNQDIITNLMVSRPHAFDSEPSYAAAFMTLGLLTTAPFLLHRARRKWLMATALLLSLFAIVATTSRSGWAGLGLGFALLAILPALAGKRVPWRPVLIFLAAVPVLVGIFLLTTPEAQRKNLNDLFVAKLLRGDDSSGNSRLKAFGIAFNMAKETHGLGTGLGASYRYYKDRGGWDYSYQGAFDKTMYGNEVIMSTWGQLLGEGGFVAVLLYALAAAFLLRSLWQNWRGTGSPLAYGSLAAALVFFGFGALWLGNVCRGDVWVWFALWSGFAGTRARA